MNKKGITLIKIIISIAAALLIISGIVLMLTPSEIEKQSQTVEKKTYPIKMDSIAGSKDSCIATLYLPNGTAKEYRIDMCAIDRYGGFVQFKSNGKYIILQGTISLEER
ncbi:MAG: hypothetical protein ABFD15_07705 [Methanofastidiosum sp.]|jgi:uncharacterized protein YxeA